MKARTDAVGKLASSIHQCVSESTGGRIATVFLYKVKNGRSNDWMWYTYERRDALVKDLYDFSMKGYWIFDVSTLPAFAWIKVLVKETSSHQTNIDAEIIDMLVKSLDHEESAYD